MPSAISYTPGWRTAPLTVTSADPAVPSSLNQSAPNRAISAMWARVSTFSTSVGRPCAPFWDGRGGTKDGRAAPPFNWLTSAVSWLATYVPATVTTWIGTRFRPRRSRSAITVARSVASSPAPACRLR